MTTPGRTADASPRFAIHRIEGTSMLPAFPPGSWVLVDHDAVGSRPGDVVTLASRSGERVIHRVIEETPAGYRTQGDNRPTADGIVAGNSLEGRAVFVRTDSGDWRKPPRVPRGRLWHTRPAKQAWRAWDRIGRQFREMLGRMERFQTQTLGTEVAVYDQVTGQVHLLNSTAAIVWQKASKGMPENDIIEQICDTYPDVAADQVGQDVNEIIEGFRRIGLLGTNERKTDQ